MRTGVAVLLLIWALMAGGCSGTQVAVHPALPETGPAFNGACGRVAVRESTPGRFYPPAGILLPGFADALLESGLATAVSYPGNPGDAVDYSLDVRFDVIAVSHAGSNLARKVASGLSLFLLAPAFWYDYDYHLRGEVDVYRGPVKAYAVRSETDAEIRLQLLALGQSTRLEEETLGKAKKSLYRQLLVELDRACSSP